MTGSYRTTVDVARLYGSGNRAILRRLASRFFYLHLGGQIIHWAMIGCAKIATYRPRPRAVSLICGFLGLFLLVSPAQAQLIWKELVVCNDGRENSVNLSIAYGDWSWWESSGWHTVSPGRCWSTNAYQYNTSNFYVAFSILEKSGRTGTVAVQPGNEYLLGSNKVFFASSTRFCVDPMNGFANRGPGSGAVQTCGGNQQSVPFGLQIDFRATNKATFNVNFDGPKNYTHIMLDPQGSSGGWLGSIFGLFR